jgi:hypothetical protein
MGRGGRAALALSTLKGPGVPRGAPVIIRGDVAKYRGTVTALMEAFLDAPMHGGFPPSRPSQGEGHPPRRQDRVWVNAACLPRRGARAGRLSPF